MADNQVNWIGEKVDIKHGHNGVGNVTEGQKNAIIELAHDVWKHMGLSRTQIAALVATMNIESGVNPLAEHTQNGKTYIGLGQFDGGTWGDAVTTYNYNYSENLDDAKERHDILSQIKVMGAWMEIAIWPAAIKYDADPSLKGNSLQEIAYGLWHQGDSSSVYRVKTFLEGTENGKFMNVEGELSGFFNDTYNTIDSELIQREKEANHRLGAALINELEKFVNGLFLQETLRRDPSDYHRVLRVEPDGSYRGSFEN